MDLDGRRTVGFSILATEYVWAERLLRKAKEKAGQAKDQVLRRKAKKQGDAPTDPT